LLVLTTIKPTLVFLVVPFLLLWALVHSRWRFVAALVVTLAMAALISLLLLPSWIGDFVQSVRVYPTYTVGQSPVWLLTHMALPALGGAGEFVLNSVLLASAAWAWWRVLRPAQEAVFEFNWALGWTLLVSALVVPRSATTNYVMLLIPTLWVFAALDRQGRGGRWLIVGSVTASLVGNWWLHLATVVGNQEQPILFVPWPALLLVVLLCGRRWLLVDARQAALWPAVASHAAALPI
jgi:hypothetical protein